MRKVFAFAASMIIYLGALSTASANGTVYVPEALSKPKHHKHNHKHHHRHYYEQSCEECPSLHSGYFGGLKAGYVWAKGTLKQRNQVTALNAIRSAQHDTLGIDGGEFGLFFGYDRYFPKWCMWLLGIEAGIQLSNLSAKAHTDFSTPGVLISSTKSRLKSDRSIDVALRFGHKIYDCSLLYVKAGSQITHFKLDTITHNTAANAFNEASAKKHKNQAGFLFGVGMEIPVLCHWSFGAEYIFNWYKTISGSRRSDLSGDFARVQVRPYANQLIARVIWKQ